MANEPSVSLRSLPRGYSFVRKGSVYVTRNCRRQTQAASQSVYVVLAAKKKQIGIAVPTAILQRVQQQEAETRADRAASVQKRDASIEKAFEKLILHEFPRIPSASLPEVLNKALQKRRGKIGRTGTLTGREKARLAVRAHIRHAETPYDQLLRSGTLRGEARDRVASQVESIARSWARPLSGQASAQPKLVQTMAAAVKPLASVSAAAGPSKLLAAGPTEMDEENVPTQLHLASFQGEPLRDIPYPHRCTARSMHRIKRSTGAYPETSRPL